MTIMDTKTGVVLCVMLGVALGLPLGHFYNEQIEEAKATGGSEVLKEIKPMIDEAVESILSNDTEKGLAQLEEVQTSLQDTFILEEQEKQQQESEESDEQ